jgi:hypothetical protein
MTYGMTTANTVIVVRTINPRRAYGSVGFLHQVFTECIVSGS